MSYGSIHELDIDYVHADEEEWLVTVVCPRCRNTGMRERIYEIVLGTWEDAEEVMFYIQELFRSGLCCEVDDAYRCYS